VNESDSSFPRVAIGLCVRNCEKTIAKTAESILKLRYPRSRFKIEIVDGCSNDNTVGIIKDRLWEDNVRTSFLSDNGQGLSFARQLIVDNCDCKYVVWVDGDNVLPTNFLKSQVKFMEKHKGVGVCKVRTVPLGDSVVSRLQGYQMVIPTSDWKKSFTNIDARIGAQGTICRVEAIQSVGGFDLSIEGAGEDTDLFIRVKSAGWSIGFNDETFIYHFMRDTWRELWKESVWWGYGRWQVSHKHESCFPSLKYRVGFVFLDCLRFSLKSLDLTKDLACIIMPLHYGLKRFGFLIGMWRAKRAIQKPSARVRARVSP